MKNLTDKPNKFTDYTHIITPCWPLFQKTVDYIERCRLEDGGYFFARIPPSSGMDTYFALKSLSILGFRPHEPEKIADFFLSDFKQGTLNGITAIFLSVEVLNELGRLPDEIKEYARSKILSLQNSEGGFGSIENINIEVPSELENTFRAIKTLKTIGAEIPYERVYRFVSGFLTPEGGYGSGGFPTLASTFYASAILKLLEIDLNKHEATRRYLRQQEETREIYFIEDMYWLVMSLSNLNESIRYPEKVIRFVLQCQRINGGFSRAILMGIPTLEYTFYALTILNETGFMSQCSR